MSKALLPALFAAALSLWAADATAQTPGRLSVDLGIGRGLGTGDGWYMDNGKGITGDVLVSYRLRDLGSGGLLVGANAGIQGTSAYATICTIGPEEGCLAPFPQFGIFAAAVGWESSGGNLRAFVGPALVHADATAAAVFGRGDVALPLFSRVSAVLGLRGTVVPDYRGDPFYLGSLSIGLRIR